MFVSDVVRSCKAISQSVSLGRLILRERDVTTIGRHDGLRTGLLHKASPMAVLVEQGGGMASTGDARIADIVPASLRPRTPVILGSRDEIERIERYHAEYLNGEDRPFRSPLFGTRSLFRPD
jgi:fructose-1,6-bisphosphatase I